MTAITGIEAEVNFYDSQSYTGTSYLPFIGFMLFLIGMVIIFIGIVNISNAKRQWNLFYDDRDKVPDQAPERIKGRKRGIVLIVIGAGLVVASFFLL